MVEKTQLKRKDLEVNFTFKMSEARFIIDALSEMKFKAERLIDKLIDQGNPQLPKPTPAPDEITDEPPAISERIDADVLALFTDVWNSDTDNLNFDFTRPGHIIAMCAFQGEKSDKLVQSIMDSGVVNKYALAINVNQETPGTTVIVFSSTQDTAFAEANLPAEDEVSASALHKVEDTETAAYVQREKETAVQHINVAEGTFLPLDRGAEGLGLEINERIYEIMKHRFKLVGFETSSELVTVIVKKLMTQNDMENVMNQICTNGIECTFNQDKKTKVTALTFYRNDNNV